MNKQELLDELNKLLPKQGMESSYLSGARASIELAITLVKQLEEPEKVVIPQFVAEAFEKTRAKNWFTSLSINAMYDSSDEVGYWLEVPSNEELLLKAWINGYEVEKEKLYYVINDAQQLMLANNGRMVPTLTNFEVATHQGVLKKYQLTEKEIKEYDARYWPFAVEVSE